MRILKRVLICLIVVLITIILVYLLLPKSGGYLKKVSAKLYVNGDYVDDTAIMYWYNRKGEGPARFSLPLITTLKGLGCEIEGSLLTNGSKVKVRFNDREYDLERDDVTSYLYENGVLIYRDLGLAEKWYRRKGEIYLSDTEYERVLTTFGLDLLACEVDNEERTIKLTVCFNDNKP